MTPALVAPIERAQAPLLAREHYGDGPPSPIVSTLAHVPEALDVTLPFVSVVLGPSAIDIRVKELVIVRTSVLLECRYCAQTHSAMALDRGVTADELHALHGRTPWAGVFADEPERALLAWVDAVAAGRGGVSGDLGTEMRAHFSEPEVVELTLLCAATMMLNRYCSALELPTGAAALRRLDAAGLR